MNRERLSRLMRRHDIAAIVAVSPENFTYATGYEGLDNLWRRDSFTGKCAVISADEAQQPVVVCMSEAHLMVRAGVDKRAHIQVYTGNPALLKPEAGEPDYVERVNAAFKGHAASLVEAVMTALKRVGVTKGTVALDESGFREIVVALRETESPYRFVGRGEDLLMLARIVKTPEEVELLRRVAAVNEAGIGAFLPMAGDLDSGELDHLFRTVVASLGARPVHFIIDETGQFNGNYHHAGGSARRFSGVEGYRHRTPKKGTHPAWDTVIAMDGYISDLGGVYSVGEPSPETLRGYKSAQAGIDRGLEEMRPGKRISQLREAVVDAVRKADFPDYSGGFAGHGIGLDHHEIPYLRPPQRTSSPFIPDPFDPEVEEGMVFCLEIAPRGFQNEVMAVVAKDGGRLLSQLRAMPTVGA